MENKIVIIIPNETMSNLPLFVSPCQSFHKDTIIKFIYNNDINIYVDKKLSAVELAYSLAEEGYLTIIGEISIENQLIAFLPNETSQNQLKYFQKRKEGLKQYNLMFYKNIKDNNWEYVDNTTTKEPIIEELIKYLEESLITNNKTLKKKLTNKEIDEQ